MINKKTLLAVTLCAGLAACSTTGPTEDETTSNVNKDKEPTEVTPVPPVAELPDQETQPPVVEEEPVVEPEPEVKPEPKPEPKPKPLPTKTEEGKYIFGQEEWIFVPGINQQFVAKIDTGATTSSISATEIVKFERDGKDWVKFKISYGDKQSNEVSLPVLRWAKVKQSNSDEPQKRPVVTSWVQVGDFKDKAEFTLTDRTHLSTPVLLGQSFFRDIAIVDISRKYVQPKANK